MLINLSSKKNIPPAAWSILIDVCSAAGRAIYDLLTTIMQ